MELSRCVSRWTIGVHRITLAIIYFMSMQGQVWSKYSVNVASQSTWVNPGDNYTANCNVPGLEALDYISTLKVKWFHNGQPLTSLCEFLSSELAQKYSCKVLSPKTNNISLLLTVKNVQKSDVGNLTCEVYERIRNWDWKWVRDELVAIKSVAINLREPNEKSSITNTELIKGMMFKFDPRSDYALTQDNNEVPHQMEVLPGRYAPFCQVFGSMHKVSVCIMMGDQVMQGRMKDIQNKTGRQFVDEDTDFRGNDQVDVMCIAEIDGLPDSKMQRTYQILVRKRDLRFTCTNSSAIVNNKRHKIMCKVTDTGAISCNKIMWKREDTGEDYRPGNYMYNNINVSCRKITISKIETTLEILQLTANDLKTTYSIVYNYPLSQTKKYQLRIPREYSNSAAAMQTFHALIYSINLTAILL
ncbi:uncharacterized protein LOC128164188 isoform X2 [Crassostrea angulata]|uniref:uncharacterized protein LOC128164188 isoform X2 n=1 Tax=Magallana angulata TaxID=2784310 RepID=UPI0022B1DB5B|nr:uncharacterized protein LOC128164188 isoform X2 [Crassostrea angulata]